MEAKLERHNLSPLNLPPSPNSSTSSSTSSTHNAPTPKPTINSPSIPRTIETTPYPTTFVQADSSSFKQVVQMLTGSTSAHAGSTSAKPAPPTNRSAVITGPKKPSFKLYERRGSLKNLKSIIPTGPSFLRPDVLSPSILDFPSLVLSPVTPLSPSLASPADTMNNNYHNMNNGSGNSNNSRVVEEKAIQEKGFYLHPSPRGAEPPRLLPLFPVTSPRVSSE